MQAREHFQLKLDRGPLFAIISRLVHQKGIDLVIEAADRLVSEGGQLAVMGQAKRRSRTRFFFRGAAASGFGQREGRLREAEARRLFAGSDFLLMPSRFEPCGLSQMYARQATVRCQIVPMKRAGCRYGGRRGQRLRHQGAVATGVAGWAVARVPGVRLQAAPACHAARGDEAARALGPFGPAVMASLPPPPLSGGELRSARRKDGAPFNPTTRTNPAAGLNRPLRRAAR